MFVYGRDLSSSGYTDYNGLYYYVNIEGTKANAYISYAICLGPSTGNNTSTVTIPPSMSCNYYYYTKDETGREYCVTRQLSGTVTTVGGSNFNYNGNITSISIPNTVTTITKKAFYYCTNLTSINIPNSVTSIGNSAFQRCENLPEINLPNSLVSVGTSLFYGCHKLSSATIPSSLTYISEGMFGGCNLKRITLPKTLTHIYEAAFTGNALTDVTLPESVTYIGGNAFNGCPITDCITIPENVNTIGSDAFYIYEVYDLNKVIWKAKNCTLIRSLYGSFIRSPFYMRININCLVIGQNVESITGKMFYNYQGDSPSDKRCIKTVISHAIVPPTIDEDCFTSKCYLYSTLYVPNGSLAMYKEADNWKKFVNIVGFNYGDVDGDGNVSIEDLTVLIDILLTNVNSNGIADVDGDGNVNIDDLTVLIDMLLSSY